VQSSEFIAPHPIEVNSPSDCGDGFRRDVWAAVLFGINVVGICWLAIKGFNTVSFDNVTVDKSVGSMILAVVALTVATSFVGIIWLTVLISYASQMIELIMWTNIILCAAIAFVTLTSGQLVGLLYILNSLVGFYCRIY